MCGIFGVILGPKAGFDRPTTQRIMDLLFRYSETRGKEASGVALNAPDAVYLAKYPLPASRIINRPEFQQIYDRLFASRSNGSAQHPICVMGHSRLVTNGSHQVHANNQPAVSSGIVGIHNGIITNVDALWAQHPELEKRTDLDTEVLLSLMRCHYQESGSLVDGIQQAYREIEGVASLAAFFADLNSFLLATNNGSLYLGASQSGNAYIFASEEYILDTLLHRSSVREHLGDFAIQHIAAGTGCLIHLDSLEAATFPLATNGSQPAVSANVLGSAKPIIDLSEETAPAVRPARLPGEGPYVLSPSFHDAYPANKVRIDELRRCTRCILPETMPFIEFDDEGVCNYCRHYEPIGFKGIEALREKLAPYRRSDGRPDCLVTLSGGRDSSYTLHLVKTELGMNPITYTYDWGMVTDLARRNQMRLCGKLGVEHILVSANLAKKRGNIRKNVLAWLKRPDLGMVPLFMAGDKQYFYYTNLVAQHNNVDVALFGENLLETTRFKSGFCGIAPEHGSTTTYALTLGKKLRLLWYYGSRYMTNPAYLNRSVLDTFGAFLSYYIMSHRRFLNVFEYVRWDEDHIVSLLIDEYNWETDPHTSTTWRIGDGTAAFYNYIYYTMAGFTENDTFRSNQIREGMITRDAALQLAEQDNRPRYDSMQWYCDIIGIDFDEAIRRINAAPKLYGRE